MRLIDADKLLGKLEKRRGYIKKAQDEECIDRYEFDFLRARIAESLHVSEVVEKMASEAVGGYWIFANANMGVEAIGDVIKDYVKRGGNAEDWLPDTVYCSNCLTGFNIDDNCFVFSHKDNFCPNCGNRLR